MGKLPLGWGGVASNVLNYFCSWCKRDTDTRPILMCLTNSVAMHFYIFPPPPWVNLLNEHFISATPDQTGLLPSCSWILTWLVAFIFLQLLRLIPLLPHHVNSLLPLLSLGLLPMQSKSLAHVPAQPMAVLQLVIIKEPAGGWDPQVWKCGFFGEPK